jgi:hypothetical protein
MPARDKAMTRTCTAASALLLSLPSTVGFAKPLQDHSRFCLQHGLEWTLQDYPPLVDAHAGMTVEQVIYTGTWLQRALVKKYTSRFELMYEYKFTEDGKLLALHGKLQRWGRWYGEADLFPDADGTIPKPDVSYRLGANGGIIQDPDDGPDYTKVFSTVPVYRTIADVPCAVLLREAEKRNATQE